jgi:hypothetical protein
LIALAARIGDAQIVLGVLIETFRSNAVAADSGFPCESNVPLEYLMGTPTDLDAGAGCCRRSDFAGASAGVVGVAGCRCSGRANADLILMSFFPKVLNDRCACPERQAAGAIICLLGLQ